MDDDSRRSRGPDPSSSNPGWTIISLLVSGMLVWGGVGWLVDHWLGTTTIFLPIGLILGLVAALYLVYVRFGRD
jgi:F0F1-type ATP synthase assembly protein I